VKSRGPVEPRFSRWVLSRLLHPHDRRYALADMTEDFERCLREKGERAARRWYRAQVVRSVIPCLRHRLSRLARRFKGHPTAPSVRANDRSRLSLWRSMTQHTMSDIRFAVRTLVKTPLVIVVTVVSLGLGIGATTFVFTVTNALLFRAPSSVSAPEDLVTVYTARSSNNPYGGNSFPDYLSMLEQVPALQTTTAIRLGSVRLGAAEATRPLFAEIVTGNYFRVLGVPLPLGRGFLPEESVVGSASRVAVISHRLWQDHFAASPDVLGKPLRLDGHEFTVIGVAPRRMVSRFLALKVDVWVPLGIPGGTFRATPAALANRGDRDFLVVARLEDGATIEQAQAQLTVMANRLFAEYPDTWADDLGNVRAITALSEEEGRIPPNARMALGATSGFLFAVAGMILLIACSNVAGIFMARANQRRAEMAVRISLGASRRRLLTMLLTESLLPAVAGGLLGVGLVAQATRMLGSINLPIGVPLQFDLALDYRVLGFAVLVSACTTLVFGLAPALQASRPNLVPSLKRAAASSGRAYRKLGLRNLLIVGQIASSLILLVGAGIAIRTLQGAASLDIGFDTERVALMSKQLHQEGAASEADVQDAKDLVARLVALPDVETAQLSRSAEGTFTTELGLANVEVDGYEYGESDSRAIAYNSVTPGYLEMIGIPILQGRSISPGDDMRSPSVAVVNQSFANRFWPNGTALGQRFSISKRRSGDGDLTLEPDRTFQIVGVVPDGRYLTLDNPTAPYFWTALYQDQPSMALVHVKGRTSAEAMIPLLRREVELAEDEYQLIAPTTFDSLVAIQTAVYRIVGKVLAAGGVFGLLLVIVGIYGVVSFAVSRRSREMAIRQAIGAQRSIVIRSLAREGILLSVTGAVLGIAIVTPLANLGESTAYGVSPLDPLAFVIPVAVLLVAALAASLIPARRITRVAPMKLLREE
jgi:predicted permease